MLQGAEVHADLITRLIKYVNMLKTYISEGLQAKLEPGCLPAEE